MNKYIISIVFLIWMPLEGFLYKMPGAVESKGNKRISSDPFITGDGFRAICNHILDETAIPFDPDIVKKGDLIFLKTDYLDFFFSILHPRIASPYILITHNSDYAAPGKFVHYLDDSKILAWFGQNCDIAFSHPKFIAIPIGLANRYWGHDKMQVIMQLRQQSQNTFRKNLLYLNFKDGTHFERPVVRALFQDKAYCLTVKTKSDKEYLHDLQCSKFALSPRGNGLDCHRTWEILLMGAIPIIKHSTLDVLFEGLPVVLINSWSEITEEFLEKKYAEMSTMHYDIQRTLLGYWVDRILALQSYHRQH